MGKYNRSHYHDNVSTKTTSCEHHTMGEAPAPRDCSGASCIGDGMLLPPLRLAGGSCTAGAASGTSRWIVIEELRALV